MKSIETGRNEKGQALAEMMLALPLLLLLAAGTVQLSLLISAKTSFEHACGQAARQYAAGASSPFDFTQAIWTALGPDQRFFEQTTLRIIPSPTSSVAGQSFLDNAGFLGGFISKVKSFLLNYSGQKWVVVINYKTKPLFSALFSQDIPFQTELGVLKYPGQD